MTSLLVFLVVLAGIGQPMQAAMNARLRESAESPALAALLSFAVGAMALAILAVSGMLGRGSFAAAVRHAPWWAWLGGLCGAVSVTAALLAVPRVSTTVVIAAAIFGQSVASLIIDHYGWFDVPRIPISASRVVGALLLFVGILLIQYKR